MSAYTADAVSLTRQLIQIDSSNPGAYEGEIFSYLKNILTHPAVHLTQEEVLPGRFNLMAELPGEVQNPALIYICHMDTVTLGDGWSVSPLGADVKNDRIYGRGSCDMKSGLACAVTAFLKAADAAESGRKPAHTMKLIATVDEEDFMRGVECAIRCGWITKDSWVLDTEPTNGQIQVAHKGRTWFEIEVKGVTAHASTPWKGADAIAAMAEIIVSIRKAIQACPSHEDLGISTVTFGQIEGGYRPYVVPDSCKVWIDMRLVPPTTTQKAAEIVETAISRATEQIAGIHVSYTVTGDRPYIEKDDSSFLLSCLSHACQEVTGTSATVSFFPGYTDTAVIAGTLSNHNCMSYGPGDLELAHKPDEYVPCADIHRCQQVLTELAFSILNL